MRDPALAETQARAIVERLALAMQSSLMGRYSDGAAARAFASSRLEPQGSGRVFGTLAAGTDAAALMKRAALTA